MVVTVGTDANVSFVATRLDARGRGLARAVTTTALDPNSTRADNSLTLMTVPRYPPRSAPRSRR